MMLVPGTGWRHRLPTHTVAKARAMACGSNPRALPDLMVAASAADPHIVLRSWIPFSGLVFRVAGRERAGCENPCQTGVGLCLHRVFWCPKTTHGEGNGPLAFTMVLAPKNTR